MQKHVISSHDYIIAFLGAGGPQAAPLNPIDHKIEEILGEKNENVDGIVSLDANMTAVKYYVV